MTPFFRQLKLFITRNPLVAVTTAGLGGSAFGISFYKGNQDVPLLQSFLPKVIAAQRINSDYRPPSLRNQFNFVADVLEKVEKSVVNIEMINFYGASQSNGSGFVATDNGLIITNAHVVSGKSGLSRGNKIIVTLPDGTKHRGVVADINYELDLAIIKCEFPAKYQALKLGRTADIRNGEFVIAMGSPLTLNNTNTFGIISNKQRSSETLGLNKTINYIQTDAAITFGNSGGPLLNLDGEVIGINSMKVTAGISFAIPIDYAIDFLDNFEKKGSSIDRSQNTRKKFIGVTMLTLSEKLLDQLRKDRPLPSDLKHGVLIWRVIYNSPAYMAGLHQEDIIIEVNGQPCLNANDMYSAVEKSNGEPVELSVIRHGMKFILKVTPVQPDL